MRKLIITEFVSLDGVMEAPETWTFDYFDEEAGTFKHDELFATGALLLGRVTYEGFAAAWPEREDEQGFADRMNELPKYVVSTTLDSADWNNSTVVREDVANEVRWLKEEPGQDIYVHGSGQLANFLTNEDLVDEYHLLVFPTVLGSGKKLFADGTPKRSFELADSKATGTGVLILTYRPRE